MKKIISLMLSAIICISLLPITVNAETYTPITIDYYNGHTYAVYDVYLTWDEAKDYCEKIGGHLVTITSEQEQNNIQLLLEFSSMPMYWLGGEKKYSWRWITGESFNYTFWDRGEPNNYNSAENALMMYGKREENNDYKWNDTIKNHSNTYCNGQFGFICEWESIITMNAITNTTSEIKSYISDLHLSEIYGMNSYNIMTEYTAIAAGNDTEMLITPNIVQNGENLSDLKVYLTQGADKILEIGNFGGMEWYNLSRVDKHPKI